MCGLVTGLMIAGSLLGAYGQVQQGKAASANAKFQQQIAIDNANRTTTEMRDAAMRGTDEERRVLAEGGKTIANTRGALASNNMDLTFGSPLDTIIDTSMEVERDAYRVKTNTDREIDDLEQKRRNQRNQASAYGAEASNAKTAGFIAGVGTALSGAAGAYKYKASIG